jgi:hypothetical protein
MSKAFYRQATLETQEGLFAVSVPGDVELDGRGHLVNPQGVFEEGSMIVAVELGVPPAGEYVEQVHPADIEEAEAKAGGNGKRPEPRKIWNEGPRHGAFRVKYEEGNAVVLQKVPMLGEFLL